MCVFTPTIVHYWKDLTGRSMVESALAGVFRLFHKLEKSKQTKCKNKILAVL
jgi:hypothetical protein